MALNTDWKELLSLFASLNVEYLIVGAWARSFYGEARTTGDIAFWLRPTPENANRVLEAFESFGFGSIGLTAEDFLKDDQVVQLGFPPRRIDLLTSLTALSADEIWAHRVRGELDGVEVWFISKTDFVANKRALGRAKDLADIEALAEGD